MVLAAGLGTRLRPLTNDRPKALVEISGRTLLEITLTRLREFGVRDVIVNVHHFADQLIEHLRAHKNFGMDLQISREEELLETGGGLKKAAHFFRGSHEPFILHNVDVISTIDLGRMLEFHNQHGALTTIAVQDRKSSRYLLFDDTLQLCGRKLEKDGTTDMVRSAPRLTPSAFSGIHIISPRFLDMMTEQGAFSIIQTYLRLASQGEQILAFRADDYYWRDLGTPENIQQAEEDVRTGRVHL